MRYQRRVFDQLTLSDVSLSVPLTYQSAAALGVNAQVEITPYAEISPHYAMEITPSYLSRRSAQRGAAWRLALRYRYAHYTLADTHLLQPSLAYLGGRWSVALHAYVVFPTFGPNSLTPQLRLSRAIARGWMIGWWATYGYETLNERFFNPARQAPRWENLIRITRFLSDDEGINMSLSDVRFFPETPEIAQELFNRDRFEFTLHYFIKM